MEGVGGGRGGAGSRASREGAWPSKEEKEPAKHVIASIFDIRVHYIGYTVEALISDVEHLYRE